MENLYETSKFNWGSRDFGLTLHTDTPPFPNMLNFCSLTSGASLLAADLVCEQKAQRVVNWMGGFHHARKSKAAGFCYANDIVLSILKLLTAYNKILYVDIDVHHGDGVAEAFYNCSNVMALSFHQFDEQGKFFPGTGNLDEVGIDQGIYCSLNVPLLEGVGDDIYVPLFENIFTKTVEVYRPDVIWLQCGADSLTGDPIGGLRLSTIGHSSAVKKVLDSNLPVILGGGGGYNLANVAKCWAYETALVANMEVPNVISQDSYYKSRFNNNYNLHVFATKETIKSDLLNYGNEKGYKDRLLASVLSNLRRLELLMNNRSHIDIKCRI